MNTFSKFFCKLGLLLVAVLILPFIASAKNMYQTHGNDYEYTIGGDAFFPVVWDIRGAWMKYLSYARYYKNWEDPRAFEFADDQISGVLLQAKNSGVNSVIIRETLAADVRNESHNYFPGRANMIRDLGLNIIPGGFGHILNSGVYNDSMKAHIDDYLATRVPAGYAPVVGIHGFNEPDGVYDAAYQQGKDDIVATLASYHTWSNNHGLPLSSFMAMPATYVPSLADPHSGTGSTIYQLCSRLDFPMLDWYPARTFAETGNASVPQADMWGATDLIPTDVSSNHYYAYNNRDELWSLTHDESSSSTTFRVYEVTGEEQIGIPGFNQIFSSQPGVSWPFEVASSDYRSADIGDRNAAEHNQNAAVVMYHTGEQIEEAEVVIHDGSTLATVSPPDLGETASTMFFCVGEDNYSSSSLSTNGNTGIIGSAEMRILWCGDGLSSGGSGAGLQKRVWILGKNTSGNGLTSVINSPLILPNSFVPVGAVWGYFWDDDHPHRQSGFVLYNNIGNYVSVYKEADHWEVSSTVETGLFGNGTNPGAVIAYRETTWPVTSFSPAKDILCAVVDKPFPSVAMVMHWCRGEDIADSFPDHGEFVITISAVTAQNYNHLSFGHCWHMNKTRFFFGGDGVTTGYSQEFNHFPTNPDGTGGWAAEFNPVLNKTTTWGVVSSPMRVRHTRKAWVYALMPSLIPNNDDMSVRDGEMREDNNASNPSVFASTELYFDNLCSPANGETANDAGAIDLEFEWGMNQTTSEANCLFANIQAFGKFPMLAASFPPSHDTDPIGCDTLLYLTVAPIIHGCRGISFYALDMALQAGVASSGGTGAPLYRAPNVMLNWGPSRDCEENADIVGRVHDVVEILTGKKGGPDFLSALVNHSDYTVLDETEAVNAFIVSSGVYSPYPGDVCTNFIALQETSGEILLLVSNDCDDIEAPYIVFPDEYAIDYGAVECWGGFDPTQFASDPGFNVSALTSYSNGEYASVDRNQGNSTLSKPLLGIQVAMPPHTVSLLRIPVSKGVCSETEIADEPILHVERSAGNVLLQLSGEFENCELSLFDLTGRKVEEIDISEEDGSDIHLNNSAYSAGMYFAVLTEREEILQMEKISIF